MPADPSITSAPSKHHGNGAEPYQCSQRQSPPGAGFAIDYGYCRTSLDHHPTSHKVGSADPRCPPDCQHKAPEAVAVRFSKLFQWQGAQAAAAYARQERAR